MTGSEKDLTANDFPVHWPVLTRWTDNDMFGHLNNAVYYELFDTAINAWINVSLDIDPLTAPWLGVVVESVPPPPPPLSPAPPAGGPLTNPPAHPPPLRSHPPNLCPPLRTTLCHRWALGCPFDGPPPRRPLPFPLLLRRLPPPLLSPPSPPAFPSPVKGRSP